MIFAGSSHGRHSGKFMPHLRPSGPPATGAVRDDKHRPLGAAERPRAFADPRPRDRAASRPRHGPAAHIALAAEPLPDLDDPAFGRLFDRFGDARVVMLGVAGDGSFEFVRARAAITRRLVERRGFNIVALDADWPDALALDARVRGRAPDGEGSVLAPFPTATWRNAEFEAFTDWLTRYNAGRPPGARAGVCGLDLYGLDASRRAVLDDLGRADPDAARMARERFGCPAPWAQDPRDLGRVAASAYEGAVTAMLVDRLAGQMRETAGGDEALLDSAASARLLRDAPAYYRAMFYGGAEAWNLRSRHMFDTLQAVLDAHGGEARAVVWAHNAHVGDARATEMGAVRDALSLGQLAREAWSDAARLIGFATGGAVAAGERDGPLRPALPDSHERHARDAGVGRFLLDLRPHVHSALRRALAAPSPERFAGAQSRDVACRLPEQFDAWVWFDETKPVTPLDAPG